MGRVKAAAASLLVLLAPQAAAGSQDRPAPAPIWFEIRVVDRATGRGVPLVELTTTGAVRLVTDSNGVAAFHEPGLMGEEVYFHVKSHGYEHPADGFGFRGRALRCEPGGSATLELDRVQIAERLHRLTGAGVYRDSRLTGRPVPAGGPAPNGRVMGQDSVIRAAYRGRIYWFWGDTSRPEHPLGNFAVAGATSAADLDPEQPIDYEYFADGSGFARPMCPLEGPGPVWLGGLMTLEHDGRTRLVAHFARHESLDKIHEQGLVVFDDAAARFVRLASFDVAETRHPSGHPVRARDGGADYFYFGSPFPNLRVRADYAAVQRPEEYEALVPEGGGFAWRRGAAPRRADGPDGWVRLIDVETGNEVRPHGGSIHWNAHRRRWLAVVLEVGGSSYLGEVWLAEADSLLGPWAYARKIVTHDRYSFYNVVHQPFLDREGGRLIHFEGTYSKFFAGDVEATPRYDYNQILYRLDLGDPRTLLPRPVYGAGGAALLHFERADGERLANPLPRFARGGESPPPP